VLGSVLVFRDVSEQRGATQASRKNQEVLQLIHKIGKIGHWEWNSLTDENKWSPEIEALYGLPPGGFEGGYEGWAKLVHPEDLAKAEDDVQHALETGEYLAEFRVIWPDGSVHWLETRAKVFKDSPDGAMRLVGVNMDITDRKRLEEELRSRNLELAKADRQKDKFLATLAHELRNPLTPISNGLQTWDAVVGDQARMGEVRSMMGRQVQQMIRLIDDLMDVARITSDKIELRTQQMDLRSVIAGAVESIRSIVDASGQQLNVTLPNAPVFVSGDAVRLTQVFGNILHNAAKFTGRNGTISIVTETQDDRAIVRVCDNGSGIPQDMLSEVFETFRQVDSTLERSHGGLGIGLMLAKRLTEMHGGTVEAQSEGLGKGSVFVVTLPALAADGNHRVDDKVRSIRQVGKLPRHRILVVDDLPDLAESFRAVLESIGQEVHTAHDGQSAIESVVSDRPDIVFLDVSMPVMNGYEVARQLRSRPELKGLTLVALTGYGHAEYQLRAKEAGFNHYVTKPIDLEKLREVLLAAPVADERTKGRTLSSTG
jgi:PAS domain S-box-containing protein